MRSESVENRNDNFIQPAKTGLMQKKTPNKIFTTLKILKNLVFHKNILKSVSLVLRAQTLKICNMATQDSNLSGTKLSANHALLNEIRQLVERSQEKQKAKSLFVGKTQNEWIEQAKARPNPKMLFGEFWCEGELCILFSDTNLGKSILAVQIANSISKGEAIKNFKLEVQKQKVLYFDFELSDKQIEARYSDNFTNHYEFDSNFIRYEINQDAEIPEKQTFEEFLHESLKNAITETNARILIIDNITYLKNETEKAKDASALMKQLKELKKEYNLSILVLAHTPKRDLSKPITRNDLQGSKMLINFCDSAFSIGESHNDKNLRYLKQIKQRSTEQIYDAENVCTCQIVKTTNFLQFEFIKFSSEREHLKQFTEEDKKNLDERVKELKERGKSLREISVELCVSHMKVSRILKRNSL